MATMAGDAVFLDTSILIYAFALNDPRSDTAETLLAAGGVISIQVLNEYVNVSRRKLALQLGSQSFVNLSFSHFKCQSGSDPNLNNLCPMPKPVLQSTKAGRREAR